MASRDRGRKGSGDIEWTRLGRNLVTEKGTEQWVVAGGEYGVQEEFLLFISAMMKLLMQMTQKRKCDYAQIKPLIAGVMWESDGR